MEFYDITASPKLVQAITSPQLAIAATQAVSSNEPAKCYLLELPAELRNQIYGFALSRSKPIEIQMRDSKAGTVQRVPM
jgi:hypothetical protein